MKGRNIRDVCRPVGADWFCKANPGLSPWAADFRTFGARGLGSTFNHTPKVVPPKSEIDFAGRNASLSRIPPSGFLWQASAGFIL